MNLFMGLLTDPFIAGRGDTADVVERRRVGICRRGDAYASNGRPRSKSERDAYAAIYTQGAAAADPFAQRWSVWAAGFGGSQTTDGNAALGSNTRDQQHLRHRGRRRLSLLAVYAGRLCAGRRRHQFHVANGLGSGRSDLFQAGAFMRHTVGAAYISGALAYGWQDITTDRTVTVAGIDQLRARVQRQRLFGPGRRRLSLCDAVDGRLGITPYAAGQFTTFDLPAYAEQAYRPAPTPSRWPMVRQERHRHPQRTRPSHRQILCVQDGILTLRSRFAWAHDFNPDRNDRRHLPDAAGRIFVVNGAAQAP